MNATVPVPAPQSIPALEQGRAPCRNHDTWAPGDAAHQGDLILVCLSKLPASAKPRRNRQLAEGQTRGSKHVVAGGEVFEVAPSDLGEVAAAIARVTAGKVVVDPQYIGPVFAGPCTLEHPEHQHQAFPDGSITAVIFQRNLDAEEREVRARD